MNTIIDESSVLGNGDMDKEEVGNLFEQYNLVSAGVVDRNKKLIKDDADDILTVVKEEAEEDTLN